MRGYQRKIIMLKGTDSQIFDEAYFLLRRDCEAKAGEETIVREAERIVACNCTERRRKSAVRRRAVLLFALGILCGIGFSALFLRIF